MNLEMGRISAPASEAATAESPHWRSAEPSHWRTSRRILRLRLCASLIGLDMLCIVTAFLLAGTLYSPGDTNRHWMVLIAALLPIYLLSAFNARAYSAEIIEDASCAVTRGLQALAIAATMLLIVAFYLKASAQFSRATFALGFAGSLVTLGIVRYHFARRALSILGGNPYNVVLIADDVAPWDVGSFTVFTSSAAGIDPDDHCPQMYDRLAHAVKDADRVVVACSPEKRPSWVRALKGANVQGEVIAPELEKLAPLGLDRYAGRPTVVVAKGPLTSSDRLIKRAFDLALSVPALVLLSPLFLAIALAIKLTSPGPVLFVQTRIGRGNRQFRMLKFRSMRVDACDGHGHTSTAREDERITPIGRFIRRTSLDELPQLLNVIRGDMSIVGPRPHALGSRAEDKLFWEIDERYWHRHAAKPGLTGLAQVRGYRGATIREHDLTNRLQADLEYLHGWSIWRDIAIILMTVRVLVHRNAF